jgi:hypothetical protein
MYPGEAVHGVLGLHAGTPLYLWVKLTEIPHVPDIGHRHSVLVREPECSGPAFFRDMEGSLTHG